MLEIFSDPDEAVAGIRDGSTVLVGGFGMAGMPVTLIDALIAQGATDLTIVSNNAGNGDTGLAALLAAGRVCKIICSFPRWCRSEIWPSGCAPPGQASARFSALPGSARFLPVIAKPAQSTGVSMCWSTRSAGTSH